MTQHSMCRKTIYICTQCKAIMDTHYTWCKTAVQRLGTTSHEEAKCAADAMTTQVKDDGDKCMSCKPLPTPPGLASARAAAGKEKKGKGKK